MTSTKKIFLKGFSYTLVANILSLLISTLIVLIMPRYIGVLEYSYWQLFMFYQSYIAYLSFGITDGIYLRYGGSKYEDLEKKVFVSQYWLLTFFVLVVVSMIILWSIVKIQEPMRIRVLLYVCMAGLIIVPRSLLTFVMQATNHMTDNAMVLIIEKVVCLLGIFLILMLDKLSVSYLIWADLLGKLSSHLYAIYRMPTLVFGKFASTNVVKNETKENIKVGSRLLIANLSSVLIIGVVRIGIERNWGIEVFGKVSLTLSISNMVLLVINAIGIVLFPILRRIDSSKLAIIYKNASEALRVLLFLILIAYYPIRMILSCWLPQYQDSLDYMALLFPMIIFESKMVLLINTYLKTLRKETLMFNVNVLVLLLSVVLTFILTKILNNLNGTIFLITTLVFIKTALSEYYVGKSLNIKLMKYLMIELTYSLLFIVISLKCSELLGMALYSLMVFFYLISRRNQLKQLFHFAQSI